MDCDDISFFPQELRIELKALPSHLKYLFLGEKNTFLVIISKELTQIQEKELIETWRKTRKL